MNLTEEGINLIKKHEGLRLRAYRDGVGLWTIGYGHREDCHEGDTCTQFQADDWFKSDTDKFCVMIKHYLQKTLNNNQFSALVSFVFNVGIANFASSTMLKLIHAEKMAEAADQFLRWDYAGEEIEPGLVIRRTDERALFLKPVAPTIIPAKKLA